MKCWKELLICVLLLNLAIVHEAGGSLLKKLLGLNTESSIKKQKNRAKLAPDESLVSVLKLPPPAHPTFTEASEEPTKYAGTTNKKYLNLKTKLIQYIQRPNAPLNYFEHIYHEMHKAPEEFLSLWLQNYVKQLREQNLQDSVVMPKETPKDKKTDMSEMGKLYKCVADAYDDSIDEYALSSLKSFENTDVEYRDIGNLLITIMEMTQPSVGFGDFLVFMGEIIHTDAQKIKDGVNGITIMPRLFQRNYAQAELIYAMDKYCIAHPEIRTFMEQKGW